MNLSQEPPNGDFVAYIERLQRESLARHTSGQPHPANATPTLSGGSPAPVAQASTAPTLSAEQARELIAKLGGGQFKLEQVFPMLSIGIGTLILIATVAGNEGPFNFFLGVGLIIWGAKRLEFLKKKSAS